MPPTAEAIAIPVHCPLIITFVCEIVTTIASGSVIVTHIVAVQPFASVIVQQ